MESNTIDIHNYDSIRPYTDQELQEAVLRILQEPLFYKMIRHFVQVHYPHKSTHLLYHLGYIKFQQHNFTMQIRFFFKVKNWFPFIL